MVKTYCKPLKRGASWRSQNFGANATKYGPHSGNDEACVIGTPVYAAGDGIIEWAGEFDDTYADNLLWLLRMGGKIAVLNCGDGEPSFVYAHLSRFHVNKGDHVVKGQLIADSGNSGFATTGAHLHVEAIPPGYVLNSPLLGRVNPDKYLTEWPEDIEDNMPSAKEIADETVSAMLNHPINRAGGSLGGELNLAAFLSWSDANIEGTRNEIIHTRNEVLALKEIVKQLSVAQGVVIDYAAIAQAVNDDAAKRLAK